MGVSVARTGPTRVGPNRVGPTNPSGTSRRCSRFRTYMTQKREHLGDPRWPRRDGPRLVRPDGRPTGRAS